MKRFLRFAFDLCLSVKYKSMWEVPYKIFLHQDKSLRTKWYGTSERIFIEGCHLVDTFHLTIKPFMQFTAMMAALTLRCYLEAPASCKYSADIVILIKKSFPPSLGPRVVKRFRPITLWISSTGRVVKTTQWTYVVKCLRKSSSRKILISGVPSPWTFQTTWTFALRSYEAALLDQLATRNYV